MYKMIMQIVILSGVSLPLSALRITSIIDGTEQDLKQKLATAVKQDAPDKCDIYKKISNFVVMEQLKQYPQFDKEFKNRCQGRIVQFGSDLKSGAKYDEIIKELINELKDNYEIAKDYYNRKQETVRLRNLFLATCVVFASGFAGVLFMLMGYVNENCVLACDNVCTIWH